MYMVSAVDKHISHMLEFINPACE